MAITSIAIVAGVPGSQVRAAPITFNTALPVSESEVIFRSLFVLNQQSGDFGAQPGTVNRYTANSVIGYGITSRLAVFGVLPTTYIERDIGGLRSSDFGIGDAQIFARFELYQSNSKGTTARLSPFAGVRLPSGQRGETGDGSTDVFGGLIYTTANIDWQFDAQVRFDLNGEDSGFERGKSFSIDASFQKRISPAKVTAKTTGFLFAVLEANITVSDENQLFGADDINSGGFQASLSPGLQYATRRWIADVAVRIPVLNSLNGTAPEADYSVFASIRVNF